MLAFINGIHLIVGLMLLYVLLKYYKDINKFIKNLNTSQCKYTDNDLKEICNIIKTDYTEGKKIKYIKNLFVES